MSTSFSVSCELCIAPRGDSVSRRAGDAWRVLSVSFSPTPRVAVNNCKATAARTEAVIHRAPAQLRPCLPRLDCDSSAQHASCA